MAQSAYPEVVKTETELTQGDNKWGDEELQLFYPLLETKPHS